MSRLSAFRQRWFADTIAVPESLTAGYYPAADGLRGIAILMVVTAHYGANRLLRPLHLYADSTLGVHLFFVISGFLITVLLLKEKCARRRISLPYFYIRRFLRLMPVLLLFLLVLAGFNYTYHLGIGWREFLQSLFFLQNLPLKSSYYTAHLWSLAVEVQFYLLFPVLLDYRVGLYLQTAVIVIMMVLLLSIAGYYFPSWLGHLVFLHLLAKAAMYGFWKGPFLILTGSVMAVLAFKGLIRLNPPPQAGYMGTMLLFLFALVLHTRTSVLYAKYISDFISCVLFGFVLLWSMCGQRSLLNVVLSSRILIGIGVLSYSIYVWQQLLVGSNCWQPWLASWRSLPFGLVIVLKVLVVVGISTASYYGLERIFLKRKVRFERLRHFKPVTLPEGD